MFACVDGWMTVRVVSPRLDGLSEEAAVGLLATRGAPTTRMGGSMVGKLSSDSIGFQRVPTCFPCISMFQDVPSFWTLNTCAECQWILTIQSRIEPYSNLHVIIILGLFDLFSRSSAGFGSVSTCFSPLNLQIPNRSMSAKAQGSTMCHWVAQIYILGGPGRKKSRPRFSRLNAKNENQGAHCRTHHYQRTDSYRFLWPLVDAELRLREVNNEDGEKTTNTKRRWSRSPRLRAAGDFMQGQKMSEVTLYEYDLVAF